MGVKRFRGPRVSRSVGIRAAITYLAGGATMREVGDAHGMSFSNVHRWVRKLQRENPGVEYRSTVHPEDEVTL